jgi:hypothetical protein
MACAQIYVALTQYIPDPEIRHQSEICLNVSNHKCIAGYTIDSAAYLRLLEQKSILLRRYWNVVDKIVIQESSASTQNSGVFQ